MTDLSSKALVDLIKNKPLAFKPGERFQYSNLGYVTLGHIIELVSEVSYNEYLQKHFSDHLI